MKGSNDLRWNEATIIEAVQEYLDKRYTPNVTVTSVKSESKNYGDGGFLVTVVEKESKP